MIFIYISMIFFGRQIRIATKAQRLEEEGEGVFVKRIKNWNIIEFV